MSFFGLWNGDYDDDNGKWLDRSPVNSPHKGQWRGAFMFTLICARINGWVNNCETGDLRRYRANYDVIVMISDIIQLFHTLQT